MEVIIQADAEAAMRVAARLVARQIRENPRSVLGLATGSTPVPLYASLARMHVEEGLDFSGVTTFNLDEYVGLDPSHPASYHHYMQQHLFAKVNLHPDQTHIPNGLAADVPAHCAAFEQAIRETGGIDLQILGLGGDGHIGFNEPGSSFGSRTRIKSLTARTRQDNARFFDHPDAVPLHVITMGLGTIMESRMCLLLAFGEAKAAAVAGAVEGPVSASLPASILQFHPRAKVLLDEAAASRLARHDYYRFVYANKPAWQEDL